LTTINNENGAKKREKPAAPKHAGDVRPAGDVHPEKDRLYKIRKTAFMTFFRVILWGFLAFIFLKGVIVSLRPDAAGEALKVVEGFKQELSGYKELDSELLAFAENFTVEYLTYVADDVNGYRERLTKYAVPYVANTAVNDFVIGSQSRTLYVNAYKKEAYTETQTDVYVLADIEYTTTEIIVKGMNEPSETVVHTGTRQVILIIPVAYSQNRYIVEDLPVYTSDDMKLNSYTPAEFLNKQVDESTQAAVLSYLSDFFGAYYGEKQSIIDNYLAPTADKSRFTGLGGLLTFWKIDDVSKVYYPNDEDKTPLKALVTLTATDQIGNTVKQTYTVTVIERDGRYYVQQLETRINNIKIGG